MNTNQPEKPESGSTGCMLVAVDFSDHSKAALHWAVEESRLRGVGLVILHVIHDPAGSQGYYKEALGAGEGEPVLRRIEERAASMLESFLVQVSAENAIGDHETRLVMGLPPTRILEVAAEVEAQLIVLGSRGRTGLVSGMLGSKALRVAQLSEVPVAIIKGQP